MMGYFWCILVLFQAFCCALHIRAGICQGVWPKSGLLGTYLSNPDPQVWGVSTIMLLLQRELTGWEGSQMLNSYISHFSVLLTSTCLPGIIPTRASRAISKRKTMNQQLSALTSVVSS